MNIFQLSNLINFSHSWMYSQKPNKTVLNCYNDNVLKNQRILKLC